ncbi:MAG: ABC transporter ATP-binding protein [Bacilli bacterium]|nr:ABC transporter ATP-binding protein [Bacilli bacterium]
MKPILRIRDLKKNYQDLDDEVKALGGINLDVYDGELLAIVGPSGCGKTSLLSILSNLENKSDGTIEFQKETIKIGYMLQKDALFPWRTILDNCLIGLEIQHSLTEESKNRVIQLLKTYGLGDFMNKYPSSLSGGMKQRVALIRTLATDPDILFLDEPFSALDYLTRIYLSEDVYNIIKKEGKTAILVTHDLAEAISLSDRVAVLSKRPAVVKKIYTIDIPNKSTPIENRKRTEFSSYYDQIWRDLDVHL